MLFSIRFWPKVPCAGGGGFSAKYTAVPEPLAAAAGEQPITLISMNAKISPVELFVVDLSPRAECPTAEWQHGRTDERLAWLAGWVERARE